MIIDCISDLHGFIPELPGGDLLIVGGDLTARDHLARDWIKFEKWILNQKYTHKIMVAGNHDNTLQSNKQDLLCKYWGDIGVTYLCDSGTEFRGMKIWGTPWTTKFDGINPKCCAFTCSSEEELASKFSLIPDDIDILISHGPFLHILDQNMDGYACGSRALRDAVDRVKPKFFICGHIHERGGQHLIYKHLGPNTNCFNVSVVDERYKRVREATRIIID